MNVCFHQQITKIQIYTKNNKAGETFKAAKMLSCSTKPNNLG